MSKKEYIDRELALNALSRGWGCGNVCSRSINRIPAADVVEVRHGEWEPIMQELNYYDTCKCSVCGTVIDVSEAHYKFCPNCGAKMDGERRENEG